MKRYLFIINDYDMIEFENTIEVKNYKDKYVVIYSPDNVHKRMYTLNKGKYGYKLRVVTVKHRKAV